MHLARRHHLLALAAIVTIGAAACGSTADRTASTPDTAPTTQAPPATVATTDPAPTFPTGADIALVRIGRDGNLPQLVIGGDGWVYSPTDESPTGGVSTANGASGFVAVRPAAIPAPPTPTPVQRRQLTAAGLAIVLGLADQLGLLAVPGEYADPGVTDMSTTQVTLVDNAGTYVHDAYALGFDDETGNRKALLDFVTAVSDIDALVGADNIGPTEAYVPEVFTVTAGGYATSQDPVDWPSGVPVEEGCIRLPVGEFPAGVAGIYIADVNGAPERVTVVPDLPGDDCT